METIETVTTDQHRKVSVSFSRKLSLGDYNTADVFVHVEDYLENGATDAEVSEQAVSLLNAAKAAAYDSLGLESFFDDKGVLREKHEPIATPTQATNKVATQMGGSTVKVMNPNDLQPGETVPANIVEQCEQLGIAAVWANSGQYGRFWREAVPRGDSPKLPDQRDPSKGGILKGV